MQRSLRRKIIAVAGSCVMGWIFSYCDIYIFRTYSYGLFIWLPMVMGIMATILYGYRNDVKRIALRNISYLALAVFCLGLLTFAWEGAICLIMAAPIGLVFTYVGFNIGYLMIKKRQIAGNMPAIVIVLCLSVPGFMAFENSVTGNEELRTVKTSIEIDAPIEVVWNSVIKFPPIPDPREFVFKMGIAYPISGQIDGKGVGAIRHCNFSTGSFVEPITVWNEPRLLQFDVVEQPEPLKEVSFYDIHPNHLHGYWVSKKGQFKLTQLPNGHVLLEGTTWYTNKIEPGIYWTLWSDYIVHKIHERVLGHIKEVAERATHS